MLPVPLAILLPYMTAVLASVNVLPLFNVPAPLNVKLLDPLILTFPPNAYAFANEAVTLDCKLPPFKLSGLVPNALVATPICNEPLVNVVVPVYELVFGHEI